eukprot:324170-Hanusia_phi.AAC.4
MRKPEIQKTTYAALMRNSSDRVDGMIRSKKNRVLVDESAKKQFKTNDTYKLACVFNPDRARKVEHAKRKVTSLVIVP